MEGAEKLKYIASGFAKHGLSPLERFLCVYKYAASYQYPKIERYDDYIKYGRDIKRIVATGEATCLGAANIMDIMLDELDIPSAVNEISFYKNGRADERHANNIVKLQDDDYRVRGIYGADACYDAGQPKFRYCLFPLHQIDELYQNEGDVAYSHEVERANGSPWEAFEFSKMHNVLGIPGITNENYNYYQRGRNLGGYLWSARKNFYQAIQCREIKKGTVDRALAAVENIAVTS